MFSESIDWISCERSDVLGKRKQTFVRDAPHYVRCAPIIALSEAVHVVVTVLRRDRVLTADGCGGSLATRP